MKRSEMLDVIRKELEGKRIQTDYANEILSVVEKLGMLPPSYEKSVLVSAQYHPGRYKRIYGIEDVNEWEPEDEKK